MILYIIRHGDPDYEHNTITPFGHQEAKALADWFADKKLDRVYTSPLGRAKDTAAYTCERKGITPEVLPWTEESMDYMRRFTPEHHCTYQFSTEKGLHEYVDFYDDRMPTLDNLATSADAFLAEHGYEHSGAHYRITNPNEEHIAIFCHGGFGAALTSYLLGGAASLGFSSMFMTTTSVTTFEFRDHFDNGFTRPRMLRFGEISHLVEAGLYIKENT